jgi:hypothetical protein
MYTAEYLTLWQHNSFRWHDIKGMFQLNNEPENITFCVSTFQNNFTDRSNTEASNTKMNCKQLEMGVTNSFSKPNKFIPPNYNDSVSTKFLSFYWFGVWSIYVDF